MPKVQKTVHGIRLNLDPRIFTDVRVTRPLFALMGSSRDGSDEELAREAAKDAEMRDELAQAIFGDDINRIEGKLRERNDGFLSDTDWTAFIIDTIKTYQKNDNARPVTEQA